MNISINDLLTGIEGRILTDNSSAAAINNVYICDLLSWVMSHAQKGDAWITVLTNVNVPAVAVMTDVSCVIIPEDIAVEELTLKKANENGIVIIGTKYGAFDICRRIIAQDRG